MRWRNIKTAPLDQRVMVSDGYDVLVATWWTNGQCWVPLGTGGRLEPFKATHWMPLIKPPKPKAVSSEWVDAELSLSTEALLKTKAKVKSLRLKAKEKIKRGPK